MSASLEEVNMVILRHLKCITVECDIKRGKC